MLIEWCVRTSVAGRAAGQAPLADMGDVAWAELLREAMRHSCLPLVWRALEGDERVPTALAAEMRLAFEANSVRNLRLAGELVAVNRRLLEAGVKAVPWKGPLLAERAYGDLRLRQFFDLDILVRRADLDRSVAVLAELGYQPQHQLRPAQRDAYVDHMGELELVRQSDGQWVELHTAIVPSYFFRGRSAETFWDRLQTAQVARAAIAALDPVDEMEALCVHGSKHRWERLAWIVDVAMLGQRLDRQQWRRVHAAAVSHGVRRMLNTAILLAVGVCDAQLPDDVVAAAQVDSMARRLAKSARASLFDPDPGRLAELRFHARMWDRSTDRARYLVGIATTPSVADCQAVTLPRPLQPMYVLVRPLRMAAAFTRRIAHR